MALSASVAVSVFVAASVAVAVVLDSNSNSDSDSVSDSYSYSDSDFDSDVLRPKFWPETVVLGSRSRKMRAHVPGLVFGPPINKTILCEPPKGAGKRDPVNTDFQKSWFQKTWYQVPGFWDDFGAELWDEFCGLAALLGGVGEGELLHADFVSLYNLLYYVIEFPV